MTQPQSTPHTPSRSGYDCNYPQNAPSAEFNAVLGTAVSLMASSANCAYFSMQHVTAWLIPAITTGQIHIFCDRRGQPVGYLTWAFLSETAERRWLMNPDGIFHVSEWNEGTRLWLIDLVALPRFGPSIIRQIKTGMFQEHSIGCWLRRREVPNASATQSGSGQTPSSYRTFTYKRT